MMTHKKYVITRLVCSFCNTLIQIALIVFAVLCLINGESEKLIPLLIVVGVVALLLFIFLGRLFCGFLCPLGLFQDITWRIAQALHLPKLSRSSKFMKVIKVLSVAFFCFFICGVIALTSLLRNDKVTKKSLPW